MKVEVAVLGSRSLIVLNMVSTDESNIRRRSQRAEGQKWQ